MTVAEFGEALPALREAYLACRPEKTSPRIAGYPTLFRVWDAWEKLDNVLAVFADSDPRTVQQAVFRHLSSQVHRPVYDLLSTPLTLPFGYNAESVWLPQVHTAPATP